MKKVLLTGATGFVGRHCLDPLVNSSYEVHAVSSLTVSSLAQDESLTREEVRWHRVDLLDKDQVSALVRDVRPTHLLHCAWYAVPGKYWTAVENFAWLESSVHLFEEFGAKGGQRAVGLGSCAEYDWSYRTCSEQTTPLNPATTYGDCKHQLQLRLAEISEQSGISAAWARLFFLYGPHEPAERLVASVVRSVLAGEPAPCSHGQQVRDFLYIQDAADALVALLESEVTGAVNIASGQAVSVRSLVEQIADLLRRKDLIQLGARPSPLGEPPLLVADIKRLQEEVGWSPRYDLATGIAATIDWWRRRSEVSEASR